MGRTETAALPVTPGLAPPAPSRRALPWIALAVGVVAIAGVSVLALRRPPPPPGQSFVVVEKRPNEPEPSPEPVGPSAVTPAAMPNEPAAEASAAVPPPSAAAAAAGRPKATGGTAGAKGGTADPVSLSRTFQRRRGQIESCFASHVKEVDGRPEVSIRFSITEAGRVASAQLMPAALSGTPLGQCLLGVARSTDFGAVGEPLTFTIPITARRVQ